MEKKNHKIPELRIDSKLNILLNEVSESIGIKKTELCRMLLNRSLRQLQQDIKLYGIENLQFSIMPNSNNGQNKTKR